MTQTGYIYFLSDPRNGLVKYIGKTVHDPYKRYKDHISDKKNNKKSSWIKSLKNNGLLPAMDVLDEVPIEEINFWEMHYISLFKSWGFDLKNHTIGGDGIIGYKHTEESKKKISNSTKGRTLSDDHKNKIRLALSGKKRPEYVFEKIFITRNGAWHSEETKRKIGEANSGRKMTTDSIKKRIDKTRGQKRTPEQKHRMSLSAKKRWDDQKSKNT